MENEHISSNLSLSQHQDDEDKKVNQDDGLSENISKKQRKKLLKKEKWLATRSERKMKEKEKLKKKKQAAAAAGISLPSRKRLKLITMENSECKQRLAIDMSFDHLMSEKDLAKCIKQVHRCYSNNRRVPNPIQFYLTSFTGKCLEMMEKNVGYRNWDVNFCSQNYLETFNPAEVVYLTSDSENIIKELDSKKVYVIGGLVDHNGHKGLCHNLAIQSGVSHGKLPIEEYLEMKTSRVLTIDHVFQIILEVSQGKSWKDAFISIIPARKGATSKNDMSNSNENNEPKEIIEDTSFKEIDETNKCLEISR